MCEWAPAVTLGAACAVLDGMACGLLTNGTGVLKSMKAVQMIVAGLLLTSALAASAANVELVGLIGQRAVLVVDGGAPQTVKVGGRTREGVRVVSVGPDMATIEVGGRREAIGLGTAPIRLSEESAVREIRLISDAQGHFVTQGAINGASLRMMVDTGATLVAIGSDDARRAGLDYRKGRSGMSMTANGPVRVWRVKLDSVKVGEVTVHNVDAAVHEQPLPFVLLGMSFLNRMDMRREGSELRLLKRN